MSSILERLSDVFTIHHHKGSSFSIQAEHYGSLPHTEPLTKEQLIQLGEELISLSLAES